MELEKVDTRKPLEKRRPTAEELGESTAKSESMTKPLILTSATISAGLRAELGLDSQYSDWTNAGALATACVLVTSCYRECRREAPDVWSFVACMHD